jgi:type II secretory pathway pseudopilin PulG
LGILAAVAVPSLIATRDDALISRYSKQIKTIGDEITSYTFSQAAAENNLSKMSNVLTEMETDGKAAINSLEKKAVIKVGTVSDCLTFRIIESAKEKNLTLSFGNHNGDVICKGVQNSINMRNYPIPLRGQLVNF